MARRFNEFLGDTAGTAAVEYAVLVGGIFLAVVVVVSGLGSAIEGMYASISAVFP